MPLGANVLRRRPAADASPLISPPRTFAPAFRLARRPTSAKLGACVPASLRSDSPAGPVGLRGKIKEEAAAAGGCRGTFAPKACRSRRARQVAAWRAIGREAGVPPPEWGKNHFCAHHEANFPGKRQAREIGREHV